VANNNFKRKTVKCSREMKKHSFEFSKSLPAMLLYLETIISVSANRMLTKKGFATMMGMDDATYDVASKSTRQISKVYILWTIQGYK
jgi:hypothetical protein